MSGSGKAAEVLKLLSGGMNQDLHWFPEEIPLSRLAAVMAGMANSSGGRILLGVSPRSAQVHGVSDPAAALDRVFQAAVLVEPPLVLPVPQVVHLPNAAGPVLIILIPQGLPNVYSLDGSYLGRDDRQTNPLPARKLRQLLMERGVMQLESRIPPQASLEDLDPDQFHGYAEQMRTRLNGIHPGQGDESDIKILLRRGCLQKVNDEVVPTYAGLLLFGRFPQQWLPNASILAARFAGTTFADQFVKTDINGSLIEQLRQAERFVRENIRSFVRMNGMTHQEQPEYPFEAVRELLVNSVAHRDYNYQGDNIHLNMFSDRLEVQSPGVLPGPVNLDNLLEARFSRNAVIVQVLSDMGYVERLGYGLDRVVAVMRQTSLRPPKFEEVAGCFKVTLFGAEERKAALSVDLSVYRKMDLNPRQQAAIGFLAEHGRINNSSYQELCPGVHAETLRRDLADMVRRGLIIKVGDKRTTYYILKSAERKK